MKTITCIHLLLMDFNCLHGPQGSTYSGLYLPLGLHLLLIAFQPPLPSCPWKHTEFHLSWVIYTSTFLEFSCLISSHLWTSYSIWISSSISPLQRGFVWSVYVKHFSPILLSLFLYSAFLSSQHLAMSEMHVLICLFICLLAVLSIRMQPFRW